jgi:GxxExxY protein
MQEMQEMNTVTRKEKEDAWSHAIIGAAIEVHRTLGPGFPEAIYEEAFCMELRLREIPFKRQVDVQVRYKGNVVGSGRLDLLIGDSVIVELKAVEALASVHVAQVLSYLRATGHRLGMLFDFNVRILKDGGIERVALSPL